MKVTISRAALLKPLQMISGVVERRQTLPILSNVLITVKNQKLFLTATDLEIEMIGGIPLEHPAENAAITVSARKLLDICRALPEEAILDLAMENGHLILRAGKSRFMLTTLPAADFPSVEDGPFNIEFAMTHAQLKKLLSRTHFAMGQQDVRHYLNGALFDVNQGVVKCVATDGHRLAYSMVDEINAGDTPMKVILPRKSVIELIRLLDNGDDEIKICIGDNHFRVVSADSVFTSKLINAQYPDYEKLIPRSVAKTAIASREALKQALTRASILSNERFRGVRLNLEGDMLKIVANNPEQEEAEEWVKLEGYNGDSVEIGFNVAYLLDVASVINSNDMCFSFSDPSAGVLIEAQEKDGSVYVVMPMRL